MSRFPGHIWTTRLQFKRGWYGPYRSCYRVQNGPYGPYASCTQFECEYIEVRDSRTGYLVPGRDAPETLPDVESSWDVAAAAVAAAAVAVAAAAPPPRPDTQSISSDTQNISSDTQSISSDTQVIRSYCFPVFPGSKLNENV